MGKLTAFEEKVLVVLKNLQYLCDFVESYKPNTEEGITYSFGEFFPPVEGQGELEYVVEYLKYHGLNISITFDIINDDPNDPIYIKQYGEVDNVPLGLIKGPNIQKIKKVIEGNINKLDNMILGDRKKKYYEIKEEMEIKSLGIKIQSDGYISKGKDSFGINVTDDTLIRYLHYRFTEERRQCIPAKILAKELEKDAGYIVNRISLINKGIKKLVLKGKTSSYVDDFIKHEKGRGYHLNQRFLIIFIKKAGLSPKIPVL